MDKAHKRHGLKIAVGITMLGLFLAGNTGAATLTVDATSVISPSIYKSFVDEYYGFKSVIEISYKPIIYQNFTLNIHVGDTVNWVNDASEDQKLTIVSEQNLWSNTSAILRWRYQLFNYTFTQPGIYDVYIKEYPGLHHQKIIVNSANYTKIQDAIDNASAGDTILVYNGAYFENVNVNKQLILRGIRMPVVNANGSGSSITLSADGVVLEGFTTGAGLNYYTAGTTGIRVTSNNNSLISNNASNKEYGIYLGSSSNNTLIRNNASSSNNAGIYLYYSTNNRLIDNIASNNGKGIVLSYSSNNKLSGNNANSNWQGIYLCYSSDNTLTGNDASNNYVNGIGLDSFGISLGFSSNNTLRDNNANSNKYAGISLLYSSNSNTLISNNANSNNAGIFLLDSSNNTLGNNNANSNNRIGIELASSNRNTLSDNNVSSNSLGIQVSPGPFSDSTPSRSNIIYNNYFNNTNNVGIINSTNTWNITKTTNTNIIGGLYLGGNFWANPSGTGFSQTCTDTDKDGICDSSYTLDGDNIDYLPLTLMKGDANRNGRLDTGDATLMLRYIVHLPIPSQYMPILPTGDMNCNDRIDTGDATLVLRDIVHLPIPRCWE